MTETGGSGSRSGSGGIQNYVGVGVQGSSAVDSYKLNDQTDFKVENVYIGEEESDAVDEKVSKACLLVSFY
jgi:hypothetical protein